MRIALIEYGMGNIQSVRNAFECVGTETVIATRPEDLKSADGIVIPGVGAFADGMGNLKALKLSDVIREEILIRRKPYLGICLGMQFLANVSYEFGETPGFGLIQGQIEKLNPSDRRKFKIPHMGWNDIRVERKCPLFEGIEGNPVFYFVHSYHFQAEKADRAAVCDHGQEVVAAVWRDNIFGVQFHPEKSQGMGLKVLENYVNIVAGKNA